MTTSLMGAGAGQRVPSPPGAGAGPQVHPLALRPEQHQNLGGLWPRVVGRGEYLPGLGQDVHAGRGRRDAPAGAVQ